MASSKTVFRPRWVSAEHSRYFTESEKERQESGEPESWRSSCVTPNRGHCQEGVSPKWGAASLYLIFLLQDSVRKVEAPGQARLSRTQGPLLGKWAGLQSFP